MALSGSVSTGSYDGRYYTLSWTATQSVADNKSTISWSIAAKGGNASWYAERTLKVVIAGTTVYSKTSRVERYKGTISSGTLTLSHSSDGTKSFSASVQAAVYYSTVNCTGSSTFTLNTIARKSTISSCGNVTLGNSCSVKWTPKSSSFKYKLKFSYGSWSYTTGTISPSTTSAYTYTEYTIPVSVASYITTATTATMSVTLTSYSGSTSLGTSSSSFTVTVPSSCVPTISSVTISEATSGLASKFGAYIQNKSTLKVVTSASQSYGSAIKSYTVSCQNKSYSGSSITTSALTSSGSITLTITVKDARGRSASTTKTVSVLAYTAPTISSLRADRCNSNGTVTAKGGYAKISYGYTISTLNNKNSRVISVSYKTVSASSYTAISSLAINSTATSSSYSNTVYPTTAFSTEYEYVLKLTVSDYFTSVTRTIRLPSADVVMDYLAAGTGVAFGKVAETAETVDSAWKLNISTDSVPAINIANSGSSGYTGIKLTSWSEYAMSMQIGSGGSNRGLYDDYSSNWMIHSDSSNRVILGNSNQTTIIYGSSVYLNGTSTAVTSDKRLKTDIGEVDTYDELFDLLNPVSFKFISDGDDAKTHFGLIYQDVKESLEKEGLNPNDYALVNTYQEEDGNEYGAIGYMELISLLVYQVQELKKRISILEGKG